MSSVPLLLAFGFSNLAILGWLAAAAAPLIIHLWMRHTHRELPWAAMRFLQAAILKHARRLQFQQWLLLAIRTLILLLIVLAAAKPFMAGWGGAAQSARTHRLLVIDTSFSMGYRTDDGTRLGQAQKLAREFVEASHPGDIYTLCTLASPPQVVLGRAVADHGRVATAVGDLAVTQGTADLAATLRAVNDLLAQVEAEAREVNRHEVLFFTDLGRNTWETVSGKGYAKPQAADAGALLDQVARQARLAVVDVGGADAANAAVTNIGLASDVLTTAVPAAIAAEVRNFSSRRMDGVIAELLVDGLPAAETKVDVAAGGSTTAKFSYQFVEAGPRTMEIRIADDRLPIDNRRYLAANVQERARVLCVAGAPGAAKYVAEALNPGLVESAAVQPRVVSESAFNEVPLEDFDCVFFCNVAQFSDSERDRINRYLQLGGGVVWFLGDRVLPEQYNEVLGAGEDLRPIEGDRADSSDRTPRVRLASYAQPVEAPSPDRTAVLPTLIGPLITVPSYGLDPLDYRHPIVEPFRGRERAGLLTTPVSRYFRLRIPEGSDAETALATLNGDPLVVTAPVRRGRVVLVATAASLDSVDPATGEPWTAMPAWPSFLPLVRGMFHYASAEFRRTAEGLVGETIAGLIATAPNSPLEVRRPDQQIAALTAEVTPDGDHWNYALTDVAGVYDVISAGSERTIDSFTVNVDPRESDLARVETSLLPAELPIRTSLADGHSGAADLSGDARPHRGMLTAVLALLLLETLLAWRFGRGAA